MLVWYDYPQYRRTRTSSECRLHFSNRFLCYGWSTFALFFIRQQVDQGSTPVSNDKFYLIALAVAVFRKALKAVGFEVVTERTYQS